VETVDADLFQGSPVLAGPIPPTTPLPFLQYIRTVRDNPLAGFHDDVFHQPVSEIKYFKLHTFLVNDPAGIKYVLIDNAANYVRGGTRVCIGASFAVTEIMLILATLAQRYRLRLVPGHKVEPRGLVSLKDQKRDME